MVDNESFIRCAKCYTIHRIFNNKIPSKCEWCNNLFNKHFNEENITDIIHNIFFGRKEQGYMICDRLGFVKGKQLLFPWERTH